MKRFFLWGWQSPVPARKQLPIIFAMIVLATLMATSSNPVSGQVDSSRPGSAIVEVQDVEALFHNQVSNIRQEFSNIAKKTAAWDNAEKAAQELSEDPDNPAKKRAMIRARRVLLEELLTSLQAASASAKELDNVYVDYVKKVDAEVKDAINEMTRNQNVINEDAGFLVDCLRNLNDIQSELGDLSFVSTGTTSGIELTDDDSVLLAEFEAAVDATTLRVENMKNARSIHEQTIAVQAAIKIEAARKYLEIRKVAARARHDRVALTDLARNDLAYLNLIDAEDTIGGLMDSPPIDYPEMNNKSDVFGGYKFGKLPTNAKAPIDLNDIATPERMERVKNAIKDDVKKDSVQSESPVVKK